MMEKAFLVYRRTWTGRISASIVHGEVRPSLEQTDPVVCKHELTGAALALAMGANPNKLAHLCAQHPAVEPA